MTERPDRYSTMSVSDLVALILDQLREADHPDEADDCPFCQAVSALNELAGRVSS